MRSTFENQVGREVCSRMMMDEKHGSRMRLDEKNGSKGWFEEL